MLENKQLKFHKIFIALTLLLRVCLLFSVFSIEVVYVGAVD